MLSCAPNVTGFQWGDEDAELHSQNDELAIQSLIRNHIRRDVRQDYGYMFLNSCNSGDDYDLDYFFGSYMAPDAEFVCANPNGPLSRYATKFAVYGRNHIFRTISGFCSQFPDFISKLFNNKITNKSNSERSEIVLTLQSEGTQLTELAGSQFLQHIHVLSRRKVTKSEVTKASSSATGPRFNVINEHNSTESYGEINALHSPGKRKFSDVLYDDGAVGRWALLTPWDIPTSVPSQVNHHDSLSSQQYTHFRPYQWDHVPLAKPLDIILNATCIMSLDENHRIEKLEIFSMANLARNAKRMYPFKGTLP